MPSTISRNLTSSPTRQVFMLSYQATHISHWLKSAMESCTSTPEALGHAASSFPLPSESSWSKAARCLHESSTSVARMPPNPSIEAKDSRDARHLYGTGAVTRVLATWPGVGETIGVDPSPVLVAKARELVGTR